MLRSIGFMRFTTALNVQLGIVSGDYMQLCLQSLRAENQNRFECSCSDAKYAGEGSSYKVMIGLLIFAYITLKARKK